MGVGGGGGTPFLLVKVWQLGVLGEIHSIEYKFIQTIFTNAIYANFGNIYFFIFQIVVTHVCK